MPDPRSTLVERDITNRGVQTGGSRLRLLGKKVEINLRNPLERQSEEARALQQGRHPQSL